MDPRLDWKEIAKIPLRGELAILVGCDCPTECAMDTPN